MTSPRTFRRPTGRSRPFGALALLALLLTVAACDTAGVQNDEATLEYEAGTSLDNQIIFTFDPTDAETGGLVDLRAENPLDVGDFLFEQGFSKDDILSATLTEASLEVVLPSVGTEINFLNMAILKLDAPGLSELEIAEQDEFPSDDNVSLDIRTGRDVTSYLQKESFTPILQIDASDLQPDAGEYRLDLVLTVRIEVAV